MFDGHSGMKRNEMRDGMRHMKHEIPPFAYIYSLLFFMFHNTAAVFTFFFESLVVWEGESRQTSGQVVLMGKEIMHGR